MTDVGVGQFLSIYELSWLVLCVCKSQGITSGSLIGQAFPKRSEGLPLAILTNFLCYLFEPVIKTDKQINFSMAAAGSGSLLIPDVVYGREEDKQDFM